MTNIRLVQIKDAPIKIRYFPAFADLLMEIETSDGLATVSLDVEMLEEALQEFAPVYEQAHERPLIRRTSALEKLQETPREDPGLKAVVLSLLCLTPIAILLAFYLVFK